MNSTSLVDISKYKFKEKVGNGSFGEVYIVEEIESKKTYAAKILINQNKKEEETIGFVNISREINISSSLNHPCILKYIGYSYDNDNKPVIFSEYLKNGSLQKIIVSNEGIQGWDDTKKLITIYGIASGMKYLHSNEIIHRDLNPKNILVDDLMFPKICDFGMSKIIHNEDSISFESGGGTKGTPLYMSPEALCDEIYTKSGDVYSFGFIVYEIVTNRIPFAGFNRYKITSEVSMGHRPKLYDFISSAYRNLIEKCWSQDPDERPTFIDIVDMLKSNQDFITDEVDQKEYYDYISYVDDYQCTFYKNNRIINIDSLKHSTKNNSNEEEEGESIKPDLEDFTIHDLFNFFKKDEKNFNSDELNENCKKIVDDADNDYQKQFLIGSYFVEGKNEFPKNIEQGLKYLEQSVNNGNIDAILYLTDMINREVLEQKNLSEKEKNELSNISLKLNYKCLKIFDEELNSDFILYNFHDFVIDNKIIYDFTSYFHNWFGVTKRGFIPSTGQPILIKTPSKNDLIEIRSFIQEYNFICQHLYPMLQMPIGIFHPPLSDIYFMITPLLKNGKLSEFLKIKTRGYNFRSLIIFGVAFSMNYLHNEGLAHFDLNPDHILISDEFYPILTKAGKSKELIKRKVNDIKNCIYFAPEILKNEEFDQKADVYSFGLLIIYIFTEKTPFDGCSLEKMIEAKSKGTFDIDDSMPKFFKNLAISCLNPDASKRPTFEDIFSQLNNQYCTNSIISNYFLKMSIMKQRKTLFRIPRQIIKLPSPTNQWDLYTKEPINWYEFNKIFNQADDKKAVLIMTIGNHQSGKSTFLKAITGNQAYYSGTGMTSTTLGLLMDGPYTKNELSKNILNEKFRNKFNGIDIDNDTQIYFIDSQGIGDDFYENIYIVLDRIHSIFCSISTICISITSINESNKNLQNVLKIVRKSQFISGSFSKMILLVRDYENFDSLIDFDFDSITDFNQEFIDDFKDQHSVISQYYINKNVKIIPLGNCKYDNEKFLYSTWYTLYCALSQVDKDQIFSKGKINYLLKSFCSFIFGQEYAFCYSEIMETQKTLTEYPEIINRCIACIYFLTGSVYKILKLSKTMPANNLYSTLCKGINEFKQFLLPFFLGDFNIPYSDFQQYSLELSNDINSFLKANINGWKNYMISENNVANIPDFLFSIEIFGIKLFASFKSIRDLIYNSKIEKVKFAYNPTIYPYIWEKNLTTSKAKNYIVNKVKLGHKDDQLLVFYDQNDNDSSLILRALTGFNVDYNSKEQVSDLFLNVPIKSFMKRYMRYGKIHTSKLENQNVNILYLKGFQPDIFSTICQSQTKKPIFISSIMGNQKLTIKPDDEFQFHLFYFSLKYYEANCVNKENFIQSLKSEKIKNLKQSLNLNVDNSNVLIIHSKYLSFVDAGPISNALLKYGCRFILQDVSLDLDKITNG